MVADVHVIVPLTTGHCSLFDYPGDHKTQLLREWVGLAVADDTLMVAAVLLSTCRYILQFQQPDNLVFARLALQYKQICLQTLRQDVVNMDIDNCSAAPVSTMTVAKALALALDEVIIMAPFWKLLTWYGSKENRRLTDFSHI
jgi:hypothetical protein